MTKENLTTAIQFRELGKYSDAQVWLKSYLGCHPNDAEAWSLLSHILLLENNLADSKKALLTAISIEPKLQSIYLNKVRLLLKESRNKEALELIKINYNFFNREPEGWLVLASCLLVNNQDSESLLLVERAIHARENYAEAFLCKAFIRARAGIIDEAINDAKLAVKIKPHLFSAWTLLSSLFNKIGNRSAAIDSLKKALDIEPNNIELSIQLGDFLRQEHREVEALEIFENVVRLDPENSNAWGNFGFALQQFGIGEKAKLAYEKSLSLNPKSAEICFNLGAILRNNGNLEAAKKYFDRAISINPFFLGAHCNLGNTLKEMGRFSEAESSYLEAIKLNPEFAEAHNNLGNNLKELMRYSSAEASIRNAIAIRPSFAEAHNNLGVILQELGRSEDALASYRKATALKPYYFEAYSNLLFTINYIQSRSIDEALQEAKQFGLIVSNRSIPKFTAWNFNSKASKIRVGFISGDLKNHPVGYFTEGLIKNFNKDLFEIISFPTIIKSDDLTIRIKPYFKEWIPIYGKTDLEAATIIYSQNIQILIDLSGHSAKNRLPVFSYKPAPVQITWLGYFATTGLPEMDYILGDPYVTPQSEVSHFSEKIRQLPETYLCFSPPNEQVFISPLPALENGFITFGCFNNLSKMGNVVVKNWASILKAVPNSKLFLKTKQLGDAKVVAEVFSRFAVYDITPDRLVIEGYSPRGDLLVAYNRVDIALDPFPYPGGTTSVEALWMGVPVLTLKGDRFLSHVGESIASNVGNTDWIAINQNDYVAKAVEFSNNLQYLSTMRNRLRHTVLQSPLFDSQHFANNFSKVLQEIWFQYLQNNNEQK